MMSENNSHNHHSYTEKMQRCQEYVEGLQEELRKIQVFHRELPLCLQLVTQAIEACKQQLSGTTTEYFHEQSECFEHTSSQGPVLEEFIPIKRTFSFDQSDKPKNRNVDNEKDDKSSQKSDWLKSVQLWNQTLDPPTKQDSHSPKEVSVMEVKRNGGGGGGGGAFHPSNGEKSVGTTHTTMVDRSLSSVLNATATASSTGCNGGAANGGSKKEGKAERKARRCWSPELHRSFLHALQQLGSPDVATPKQIRELMKVDGLTNDEVKSHLQKYRLHTRRPTPSIHNNNNPQAPQFVVVGGIWIPPPEYTAVAASGEASGVATTNRIYAPIAAPLPPLPQTAASQIQRQQQRNQFKQLHSDERLSHHSEDGVHSNSPATSSSTHTTTASHAT